jgi:hypothetical protein
MVDDYALPQSGVKAWPGRSDEARLPFPQKAACNGLTEMSIFLYTQVISSLESERT